MKAYKTIPGLILLLTAGCGAAEKSVLQWSPGMGEAPRVSVEVQWFKNNDFESPLKEGVGRLQPLSGVMDTFCVTDVALRHKFSDWVSAYAFPKFYHHPAHVQPSSPNVVVTAFHTPYECYQSQFLNWMKTERGQEDFLLPAARKMNPYKGDLVDPVVSDRAAVTEELLQKTFGCVAVAEQDKITFIGDNRYNPLRWICPINEIHHREQPSWAMRLHTKPELWPRTVEILQENRTNETTRRIVLRYEVALKIEDCRAEMDESSLRDYLRGGSGTDLIAQCYNNSINYAVNGASREGVSLEPIQRKMVEKYIRTRLEPVNFQLSVGINFKERDNRYRLAEFMLCSYNQKPVGVFPEESADGKGFLATACDALNPLVADGGNNGAGSWWRLPVSVLNHRALTAGGKSSWSGSDYLELKKPQLEQTVFKGEIDVTEFYRQALAAKAFPGQRGFWVNRWVGFEGDAPEYRNPDEQHGIEWAFFIFESHGPLKVEAEVRQLDVVIAE
jgi:hypothetical protein